MDEIRVYLGQHNICQDMHRTKVEQLIIKNDYDGHNNDIALLKVAKMKFSSKVYPACLPTSNFDYTKKKGEDVFYQFNILFMLKSSEMYSNVKGKEDCNTE